MAALAILVVMHTAGCYDQSQVESPAVVVEAPPATPPSLPPSDDESAWANAKRAEIGPNVVLEVADGKRRVLVTATVCLREGYLEHFLSRTQAGKQHESIVTAEFDARHLRSALEVAGAKPGRPVQFYNEKGEEEFKPPTGDVIKVKVQYEKDGKKVTHAAQRWVRSSRTKNELKSDWVFCGSQLFEIPGDKEPYFGANDGRIICLANFTTALLDLPIKSIEGDPNEGLDYEAFAGRIPPLETPVTVILEPVLRDAVE